MYRGNDAVKKLIALTFSVIAFWAFPCFAEEAKVSPTLTVQKTEQGVTFSLQQLLPDQVNAFYLGRGFTSEQIKPYVESCVYTAVLRNDNAEERIHFLRSGWNVKTNDASQTIKTNAEWLTEFTQQQTTPAALLAFDLAQIPEEQEYEPKGDWNQGMLSVGLPADSVFAITIIWDIAGKPYQLTLNEVNCVK